MDARELDTVRRMNLCRRRVNIGYAVRWMTIHPVLVPWIVILKSMNLGHLMPRHELGGKYITLYKGGFLGGRTKVII